MPVRACADPCSNMKEFETIVGCARRFMAGIAGVDDENAVQ